MRGLGLVVALLLGLALAAPRTGAQVVLDGSLGGTSGPVPGGVLPDGTGATHLIEESYGRRSGANLFHSFSRFDIPTGQSAAFTGDASIERVVGRVTGGTVSQINGALRNTIDGADLYLMNPRGVLFGATASLDLRGSLHVSSGNTLRFEDGVVFSAMPASGEVLSAAAPSAWGFSTDATLSPITFINARSLAVPAGETLSVVGAGIVLRGFPPSVTLQAAGGTIALASRATAGEVPVNVGELSARDAAAADLGSVSITNAVLDVSDPSRLAPSRGRIVIRGGGLTVDTSELRTNSAANAIDDSPDIDLEATRSIILRRLTSLESAARESARGGGVRLSSEAITLSGASVATTTASESALAGSLEVDAGTLQLSESSRLATVATADGTAATVSVNARTATLDAGAQVSSQNDSSLDAPAIEISVEDVLELGSGASVVSQARAVGAGASLQIAANSLEQSTGARIESGTMGVGAGGDVEIEAATVDLRGDPLGADPGGVFATSFGPGASGGVAIDADDVSVAGGAQVSATVEGAGAGGDIEIAATDQIQLQGRDASGRPSGVFARSGLDAGTTAIGDGGSIVFDAPEVLLSDGAEISAQTFGAGAAGGIHIVAPARVALSGLELVTSSINAKASSGAGGNIAIETAELAVDGGGEISVSTLGTGDAGDVSIDAQRVTVGGGAAAAGIFAQSIPTEDTGIDGGDGGSIDVRASRSVELRNGGVISARTRGSGAAGNVRIAAPVVSVAHGGEVSTQTFASGPGGSIAIDAAQQVIVMNGGTISARSTGAGNAGSIAIDAGGRFSARNGGQVTTSAVAADGGDIEIHASHLIHVEDGHVTTDVQGGLGSGGNITLDPEFVVLNRAELRASAIGDGGNITIQTSHFLRDASSVVNASSELGIDGEIQTTSPTVDLTSELAQLDTTFLDASSKLAAACAARSGGLGTFAVRGRARPSSPDAPLGSSDERERAPGCDEPRP